MADVKWPAGLPLPTWVQELIASTPDATSPDPTPLEAQSQPIPPPDVEAAARTIAAAVREGRARLELDPEGRLDVVWRQGWVGVAAPLGRPTTQRAR